MSRHPLTRTTSAALLLGLSAVLAACGGAAEDASSDAGSGGGAAATTEEQSSEGAGSTSDGAAPDPCELITAADLEAAFGLPFEEGDPGTTSAPFTFHGCGFGAATDDLVARTVTIQTLADGDIDPELDRTAADTFTDMRASMTDATDVADLGDEAFATTYDITFLQDGVYVNLVAPGGSSDEARAGLEQLAHTLSDRL